MGPTRASTWDLAVECVEETLRAGAAPSLERLGHLGQLGSLPSFVAALAAGEDVASLAADHGRERESLGLAPREVVGELLALGRVLDRHHERGVREALDRCVGAYVERVTTDLAERARRDPLTGLLNHRAFHVALESEVGRARRYRGRLALVLFDLDRFKETNDREGHQEGDRVLRAFASALATTVRETDAVGRIGGDEFGALLLQADAASVRSFLDRLARRVPEGIAWSGGWAELDATCTTAEALFSSADARLYADKRAHAA